MRTSPRSLLFVLLAVSAIPLACKGGGCGGDNAASSSGASASSTSSAAPSASELASASASAQRPRNAIRAGGTTGTILRSVQGLTLSDEQKATMEQITTDLSPATANEEDGGVRAEMRDMHAELIAGVKAGKIDTAKIDAHETAIEANGRTRRLAEADALNKAWKMLDPTQRKAAVATVRTNEEKRQARMHRRDKDGGGPPNFAKMKFEHYTKDLGLDADQQKKVDAMMPKDDKKAVDPADEAKKQLDDVLAGFESDSFDARKFESAEALKKRMTPMADTVKFLAQLTPVLKPDQRDKLAAQMDKERAGAPEGGRMRRAGRGAGQQGGSEDEEFLNW